MSAVVNSNSLIDVSKMKTVKVVFTRQTYDKMSSMPTNALATFSFGFNTSQVLGHDDQGTYQSQSWTPSDSNSAKSFTLTLDVSKLKGEYYFWAKAHSYRGKGIKIYIEEISFE